jgi:hypothetical protein
MTDMMMTKELEIVGVHSGKKGGDSETVFRSNIPATQDALRRVASDWFHFLSYGELKNLAKKDRAVYTLLDKSLVAMTDTTIWFFEGDVVEGEYAIDGPGSTSKVLEKISQDFGTVHAIGTAYGAPEHREIKFHIANGVSDICSTGFEQAPAIAFIGYYDKEFKYEVSAHGDINYCTGWGFYMRNSPAQQDAAETYARDIEAEAAERKLIAEHPHVPVDIRIPAKVGANATEVDDAAMRKHAMLLDDLAVMSKHAGQEPQPTGPQAKVPASITERLSTLVDSQLKQEAGLTYDWLIKREDYAGALSAAVIGDLSYEQKYGAAVGVCIAHIDKRQYDEALDFAENLPTDYGVELDRRLVESIKNMKKMQDMRR